MWFDRFYLHVNGTGEFMKPPSLTYLFISILLYKIKINYNFFETDIVLVSNFTFTIFLFRTKFYLFNFFLGKTVNIDGRLNNNKIIQ